MKVAMKSLVDHCKRCVEKYPSLKSFLKMCISLDQSLDRAIPILFLLLAVVLLRIPNFFEPYWYGDEAIYLTIGNALSNGAYLYQDIVDHKTPLIYYLAMVPTQFWFRVLLLAWMLITTTAFYYFSLRLLRKIWLATTSTALFVILTTLPWLEGNIPNGELFVMGFVIVGGYLLSRTAAFDQAFSPESKSTPARDTKKDIGLYVLTGILFSLAILTKVPAIFDVAAFMSIFVLAFTNQFLSLLYNHIFQPTSRGLWQKIKKLQPLFMSTLTRIGIVGAIIVGSIVTSILYYALRGTLGAYLEFGLLYNFHYVQSWGLKFDQAWLSFFYTMPGKMIITGALISLAFLLRPMLRPRFQFMATWVSLALFASLLSNRPYPHYFLQVVPPIALVFAELAHQASQLIKNISRKIKGHVTKKMESVQKQTMITTYLFGSLFFFLFIGVLLTLDVGFYPVKKYYQRSIAYLSGQIDTKTYHGGFSSRMKENYEASEIIAMSPDPKLFIWGTNPELYALTRKQPVGRFTVSFHIKDLKLHQETAQAVMEYKPHFIVVMNNEQDKLPGLQEFLAEEYLLSSNFEQFQLWKKIKNSNTR
jgi:hypothetical protein